MISDEVLLMYGLLKKHREDHTKMLQEKSFLYARFYKVNFSLNASRLKNNPRTTKKRLLEGEIFYLKYQREEIFMAGLKPP